MSQARLRTDESGVAVVEYVVLLGLLVSLAVMSVSLVGTALSDAWGSWSGFAASTAPGQREALNDPEDPLGPAPVFETGEPIDTGETAESGGGRCAKAAAHSQCAARNPTAGADTPKRKP